jgi:hypothetical protein
VPPNGWGTSKLRNIPVVVCAALNLILLLTSRFTRPLSTPNLMSEHSDSKGWQGAAVQAVAIYFIADSSLKNSLISSVDNSKSESEAPVLLFSTLITSS